MVARTADAIVVEAAGVGYEVLLPGAVAAAFADAAVGEEVSLVISYHLIAQPSRITPLLVGFTNEVEKEFFEHFITVSGIGPRAAARALTLPFARVAQAILDGDVDTLTLLPGVGKKRAAEIIHQLKDKVAAAAFCRGPAVAAPAAPEARAEAEAVLTQLGYTPAEIKEMFAALGDRVRECESAEEVLALVYAARRPAR